MSFIQDFHKGGKLPKAVTSAFLVFIPKRDNPQSLDEYRSICLISGMLKIIYKLLEARIRKYIGKLISYNQTTFIPERQILYGVLVTNEIIDYAKRFKKDCFICKVDFA